MSVFSSTVFGQGTSLENQVLYRPYRPLESTPAAYALPYEDVHLLTTDSVRLQGWFIPAGDSKSVPLHGLTLLYCHGNAGNISHRLDRAKIYHRLGMNVLLFDYRGYGKSEGSPSEDGTYRDAESAWEFLTKTKQIAPDHIVLYGESLGVAVALQTALTHPPRAAILESGFTSTVEMARRLFPQLPVDQMIQNRYDNIDKISKLNTPVLVLHSSQDTTVPYEMGRRLYAAAHEPKTFFELHGTHYFGYRTAGPAYAQALVTFLSK